METVQTNIETEPKKKISKAGKWLRANVGFIEEVTDPELRSQLANYRNKDHESQFATEIQ